MMKRARNIYSTSTRTTKKKKPAARRRKTEKFVPTGPPFINYHFVGGPKVEFYNYPEDQEFTIKFINKDTGQVYDTRTAVGINPWVQCKYQYFVNWKIVITSAGKTIRIIEQDLKNQRVFVAVQSSGLGDTLAWMPYAEEFRKKHGCHMMVSTYMNDLFKKNYPEIEWIEPTEPAKNILVQYNIGWFYDEDRTKWDAWRHPLDPKRQPMQKTASDILGLEFEEIKPKLTIPKVKKTNLVGIGIHSTAQVKYWNNPTGWQEVVNYVKSRKGYQVINLSKEKDGHNGNKSPKGTLKLKAGSINAVIKKLAECKAYVGIGSGLTWLAWACNVPVVLVSGFSAPWTEMAPGSKVKRISTPEGLRLNSESFNNYTFDINDWWWYEPANFRGTDRMFECSKFIEGKTVIKALKEVLGN